MKAPKKQQRDYNRHHTLPTSLNPYSPNVTFLCPLKTSENPRFPDVFRGYRNVTLREYGIWVKVKGLVKKSEKIGQKKWEILLKMARLICCRKVSKKGLCTLRSQSGVELSKKYNVALLKP